MIRHIRGKALQLDFPKGDIQYAPGRDSAGCADGLHGNGEGHFLVQGDGLEISVQQDPFDGIQLIVPDQNICGILSDFEFEDRIVSCFGTKDLVHIA